MTRESYIKMQATVKNSKLLSAFTISGGRLATFVSYAVYPLFVIWLVFRQNPFAWKAIIVPATGFVILSAGRYIINAKRPYQIFDTPPIVDKKTEGKSFPSRHVFSSFIIATTIYMVYPQIGLGLYVFSIWLAASRVLSGVHFVRDVVAGAICGVGFALIGFMIM